MILRGLYGVWIIGCVACLIAFMSVFFSSRKFILKAWSTPPRHLLDTWISAELPSFFLTRSRHLLNTWLFVELPSFFFLLQSRHLFDTWWIDWESSCLLDSFSTARSIDWASVLDMVGCSSTLARHLHLLMTIFSTPTSTACSIPLDTYISRDLLIAYIFSSCNP